MSETTNLELWSKVEKTDPKHTKKVTFGRGFTAIDPYYQIRCATEQFGPAGKGWGWEVVRVEEFREIASLGLLIRLWHGEKENYIEQWGQGGFYTDKNKSKPDHDVLKKATTDGITKCLSYLGFNADVFTGKFDDNKYVQQMNAEFNQPIDNTVAIRQDWVDVAYDKLIAIIDEDDLALGAGPATNIWSKITNDERMAVTDRMKHKSPNSNKMYKSLLNEYLAYTPTEETPA